MRILTLISAFLFAAVLASFVFFGYWKYSSSQMEQKMPEFFNGVFAGEVKYQRVVRHWDPMKMSMTIKGLSWTYFDAQGGRNMVIDVGDVLMESDVFGFEKVSFKLPQNVMLTVADHESSQRYRISTNMGKLDVNMLSSGDGGMFLSTNVMMISKEESGRFQPVIQTGYSYLGHAGQPKRWSVSLNNMLIHGENELFMGREKLDNLAFNWHVEEKGDVSLAHIVMESLMNEEGFISTLKQDGVGIAVDVRDGRVSFDEEWYSLNGKGLLGAGGKISGEVFVNTNRFENVLSWIQGVTGPLPLALERMMRRLEKVQSSSQGFTITLREGRMFVNGSPAGEVDL